MTTKRPQLSVVSSAGSRPPSPTSEPSTNFGFLATYDGPFHQLAVAAEKLLAIDPNTAIVKVRQLAEAFARHAAAVCGFYPGAQASFLDTLRLLEARGIVEHQAASLFHALRREGNRAAHDFSGSRQDAVDQLRIARQLAVWFHRTFGGVDARFSPGPFVPPEDPSARLRALEEQLATARAEAETHQARAAEAKQIASLEAARRAEAESARVHAESERGVWEALAEQIERDTAAKLASFEATLAMVQATAEANPADLKPQRVKASVATQTIDLDEAETRVLIDAQLRAAGWEVDSHALRYGHGTRPEKGRNLAIAEWPTADGIADYVLFLGLEPVGIVEAKKAKKNVPAVLGQAKRYAAVFPVPFLYATNGRPYVRQLETASGVWFLDRRKSTNLSRALDGWHGPAALRAMLDADADAADAALKKEPTDYLGLRDYQLRAIAAVEAAIAAGKREVLVAMATGTGKTRTIIGLIYRLLKTQRFRCVLFLVDRAALGEQAQNAFKEMRLEKFQTFAEIYEVMELDDVRPESETKVHVATVQGMVQRILYPGDGQPAAIDDYDCVIVDESHRGYTLDREMTEGERELRSFNDFVSTYRRVLDHFDAVKVGLTATPALHTREIFGDPVFTYSYREAIVDEFLVDHAPPIRMLTELAKHGIHFTQGTEVAFLKPGGVVELSQLPDELDFDVEGFNKQVITEGFNKAIAAWLAPQLDPNGEAKTLAFCVTDAHADLFVGALKQALKAQWGELDDDAVRKITGTVDKPLAAIRRFKNERFPSIAVTVDLLTTGVDIPPICNLIFIRRVRSRILYEQMLGRATRLCPEIGKEVFRIYDCVDLYKVLEPVSSMKPVVRNPNVTLTDLLKDLVDPRSLTLGGADVLEGTPAPKARTHADDVKDQLVVKLRHRVRRAQTKDAHPPAWTETADAIASLVGTPVDQLVDRLRRGSTSEAIKLFVDHPTLPGLLERLMGVTFEGDAIPIHEGTDKVIEVTTGYGDYTKPEDYLDAFGRFVAEQMNLVPALAVVVQRPRDLTRADLKALRLALATAGFSEATLRTAWHDATNEDIAATIIGFIRQRALGSPLVPYAERVDRALKRIVASRKWTDPQRKWLSRLAEQMKKEVILDDEVFTTGAFASLGGKKVIDRALDGQLATIVAGLSEGAWRDAG